MSFLFYIQKYICWDILVTGILVLILQIIKFPLVSNRNNTQVPADEILRREYIENGSDSIRYSYITSANTTDLSICSQTFP